MADETRKPAAGPELAGIVAQAISPRAYHFRERLRKTTGAGTDSVRFGPVKPQWRYAVYFIALESNSSSATEIRAYVDGHGYKHYFFEQDSPAANTLYTSSDDFFLEEGESLVFEWAVLTANDIINAYLNGFWVSAEVVI